MPACGFRPKCGALDGLTAKTGTRIPKCKTSLCAGFKTPANGMYFCVKNEIKGRNNDML